MSERLPRVLKTFDLISLTLGAVIGSGIFIVPAIVFTQTGGQLIPALLVWAIGGVLSLLGALTYAELAAMKPESGGIYVYIRDAFGNFPAFLYGWAMFLVIGSASVATLVVAFTSYLQEFVPLSPVGAKLVAVGMTAVIAVVNVIGTRRSANLQNWTSAIKVIAILVMSVLLIGGGNGLRDTSLAMPGPDASVLLGMGAAMLGILWAYEGWQSVTYSAGEVIDPQRNFPRGIIVGTAGLIGIYLLANVAYVAALGMPKGMTSDRIAAEAVTAILGANAGKLVTLAILVSMFSAANAVVLTATRVYFAMAQDGVFFKRMGAVHPKWKTPAFAVIVSCVWGAALAASGTFEQLLTYVVFVGWAFYSLGAASIFYYRRRQPDAVRPFRVPGYPVTTWLFIAISMTIVINTIWLHPGRAVIGIGLVLLGVPAYWFWKRQSATTAGAYVESLGTSAGQMKE